MTCRWVWRWQSRPTRASLRQIRSVGKDDTDNGEAPTISQEPRPARRLVLVGGRSGRGGVEARHPERDPLVHVDADADSAVSDGGPDSVAGVSSASEAEKIKVPVVVRVPPVRPSVAAQRSGFGQIDHWDISEVFSCRAVMALEEPKWKLFLFLPRMLLYIVHPGEARSAGTS